jgi:hypothetical protein
MTDVRVIHSSQQFSDSKSQHAHDAEALFAYATKRGALFVTGTEAGGGKTNHDLRDYLVVAAKRYGFTINAHKHGDWTSTNASVANVIESGYAGPFIPGTTGLRASQGAHAPRGVTWQTASMQGVGLITIGSAHYLTQRSIVAGGVTNEALAAGIAAWGADKARGKRLVIINADVNMDDAKRDVFLGHPFTSCWDELGKHPATHGRDKQHGSTIDVSASYDADKRVSAKAARVLDDNDLQLFTDHFAIEVVYAVSDLTGIPKRKGKR